MPEFSIERARARLGDLITAAQQGADIIITRNRRPVARLTAYQEDTMPTITARDARDYVTTAIEAGDATRDELDIEAICDELRDLAGGWDFSAIEHDTFWAVVAKHAVTVRDLDR